MYCNSCTIFEKYTHIPEKPLLQGIYLKYTSRTVLQVYYNVRSLFEVYTYSIVHLMLMQYTLSILEVYFWYVIFGKGKIPGLHIIKRGTRELEEIRTLADNDLGMKKRVTSISLRKTVFSSCL